MPTNSALVTLMERAARKAGQRLRRDFGEVEHLQISHRGPSDFVMKAHQRAERTIYDILQEVRTGWGFLFEEGGDIPGDDDKPRWVIDPLSGMTNFLHAIPHCAISLAVQERDENGDFGEVISAVVYQPISDETYWAEPGQGAWLGGKKLNVSARRSLDEALIATGIPYLGHGNAAEWTRIYEALGPVSAGMRRFGSAALDLAWLAAGRYDGLWETGLQPWDVAAGALIVKEAGGFVSDFRGGNAIFARREILAANRHLHSPLHKQIVRAVKI